MPTSNFSQIKHKVQFYETDAMKIVHHANYVRWMEEARLQYFEDIDLNWKMLEMEKNIMIPVLYQSVQYIKRITFLENVIVSCKMDKFNGIKMNFTYEFRAEKSGEILAKGITRHGFIDQNFKPINIQKECPECYDKLRDRFLNT